MSCKNSWKFKQPSAKIIPVKITQNKESKMSSSTDNDIVCLNFRLRNAENKNTIKISKNKKVSDLENEVRKRLWPIDHNDFLVKLFCREPYANRR
ncbi:uncharacterized protein OCT59_003840 [Rhizophagus irregularis]|uniref:uncharacterized protein n=1 Tax=Rhizophagus irregularis TaxID=588596 RepID=UPI003333C506|nr:hypothetical protein OCT59_003840 [Rhizophagus irregularis]